MDAQEMFNLVAGILGAIGGWLLNTMWQAVRSLETKVAAIDVLVAGQYVKKEEVTRMMDAIFAKLEKIQEAIQNKADKP